MDFEALLDYTLLINFNVKNRLEKHVFRNPAGKNMHLGILVLAIHFNSI